MGRHSIRNLSWSKVRAPWVREKVSVISSRRACMQNRGCAVGIGEQHAVGGEAAEGRGIPTGCPRSLTSRPDQCSTQISRTLGLFIPKQEDAAKLCARRLNTKTRGHTNGLAGIVLPLYSASVSDPSR